MSFDKIKQLQTTKEDLDKVMSNLIGHNADCYCNFCVDKDTRFIKEKLSVIHGHIINLLELEESDNN